MKKRTFTNDADFDQALVHECARIPKEIQPDTDLWPGIAEQLSGSGPGKPAEVGMSPSRTKTFILRLAAGLVLVVGSSMITLQWSQQNEVDTFVAEYGPSSGNFGAIQELDPQYVAIRQQLVSDLEGRLPDLTPETREIVEQNLKDIEVSLAEINVALQSDPNNAGLQKLLLATYQQELNMLSHMNQVVSRRESVQL